ncbi:MAG: hypothetical protein LQ342_007020 [Letrouitia transgressa]|nr:MAG: hypothetical protein LQ342_007020 [Letrouitia transgressa]
MKNSALLWTAGVFYICTGAVQLLDEASSSSTLELPIKRKHIEDPVRRDALRRRAPVSQPLDNEGTLYFANISLGTPAQEVRLHIDTGSSDLWCNAPSSAICQFRNLGLCSDAGTYDANSSSSYEFVSSNFNISYADGSGASGDYATDTVRIGREELTGLQFGIGYVSSSTEGVLGVGYTSNEAQANYNGARPYSNLPQLMVDRGVIQSNAYSLWLDDLESSTGSILFGGVDTDKFFGSLQTLPIQPVFDQFAEFFITLSGVGLSGQNGQSFQNGVPVAVLLDSGSSLTYLPSELVEDIYDALNVRYSRRQQVGIVDCGLADEATTLDFMFTSINISVPMSELVIPPKEVTDGSRSNGNTDTSRDGESLCLFGIAPSDGTTSVLGDTWLRSAYVVYDLGNNEISLAQTNFNATTSRVVAIGTGDGSVPGASSVPSPIQASVTRTGGARINAPTASISTDSTRRGSEGNMISLPPHVFALVGLTTAAVFLFT